MPEPAGRGSRWIRSDRRPAVQEPVESSPRPSTSGPSSSAHARHDEQGVGGQVGAAGFEPATAACKICDTPSADVHATGERWTSA